MKLILKVNSSPINFLNVPRNHGLICLRFIRPQSVWNEQKSAWNSIRVKSVNASLSQNNKPLNFTTKGKLFSYQLS